MGFSFHNRHKRNVDAEKHLKRLHKTTPFIESPLTGADHDNLVFSQRHEANTVELFFDLFFVANLATFTTYHSVTDHEYLITYIGFFGILWSCWFQVTLHDVRFARDSIYERICKTIQFIVFVGLALVGSAFNPGGVEGNNTNFRILCYTLVISRTLLTIQYAVIFFYTWRANYKRLFLPLGIMIAIYAVAAGAFGAMTPAFQEKEQQHQRVYLVWYIVMVLESVGVVAISSIWRMLSFKKTHLMERMSLLTLIVIGEGAIGITKTVSRIMGKTGLEVEGCFLIMCIICVLVLLWAIYFDNFPHGHYGTIRQQIWSLLHFPFQLAIVGVVEGSQQVALARYVIKNYAKIDKSIIQYCYYENLDGQKLQDKLMALLEYWQFSKKMETIAVDDIVIPYIESIGNATGICSSTNATDYMTTGDWPLDFAYMTIEMFDGVYQGLGMKIGTNKLEKYYATDIAIKSWKVVYLYYWGSFSVLMACSVIFLFLIRRHKADLFDYVSVISRLIAMAVGGGLIALVASDDALYGFIGSPGVLPTCLALLFLVLLFDKLSAAFCNWRLKKTGQPYALEYEEHHHGGDHGHDGHGSTREIIPHHEPLSTEHRKSTAWSTYSDTTPLTEDTSYAGQQNYAMTPLMSPPLPSPTPAHGGYAPLTHQQTYGA